MIDYLLVAAGAAVGAPLRYLTDRIIAVRRDAVFPVGTLLVNVVGSLVLGAVVAATLSQSAGTLRILVGTGFCGALTTYSTFSYDTIRLLQEQATRAAVANAVLTVVAGIGSAAAAFAVTRAVVS